MNIQRIITQLFHWYNKSSTAGHSGCFHCSFLSCYRGNCRCSPCTLLQIHSLDTLAELRMKHKIVWEMLLIWSLLTIKLPLLTQMTSPVLDSHRRPRGRVSVSAEPLQSESRPVAGADGRCCSGRDERGVKESRSANCSGSGKGCAPRLKERGRGTEGILTALHQTHTSTCAQHKHEEQNKHTDWRYEESVTGKISLAPPPSVMGLFSTENVTCQWNYVSVIISQHSWNTQIKGKNIFNKLQQMLFA